MDEFDPIHVDFLLNKDQVQKDSAKIRAEITGTDATAQKSAQKVGETVKRVYSENQKEVDKYTTSVKRSTDTVGDHTKKV
ncbi:MAG: hypothetical protein AAGA66_08330, partial [Bacteroidota bacterium]